MLPLRSTQWLNELLTYLGSVSSLVAGLAAQLFAFVILARYLGVEQFGVLMTMTAATALAMTVCGLGGGDAMVRRLARRRELYAELLGHNLILTLISGIVLTICVTTGLAAAIEISPHPIVNLCVIALFTGSSIVLYRWIGLTEQIFLGRGEFTRANVVNGGFAAVRALTVMVACLGFNVESLISWMLWHSAIHIVGGVACAISLRRYPRPVWRLLRDEIGLGIHACTPVVFDSLRQNIDRLVLSAIAPPEVVGVYGASTRFIQLSVVSITAMSRIIYPKLAVAGEQSLASAVRLSLRYFPLIGGIAALTSLGIYFCADFLPYAFGGKFADMVPYVRIMSWLLILSAICNIAYDALGAADRHAVRAHVFNANALLAALLIAGLTWKYGVRGAFTAMFAAQLCIGVSLWTVLAVMTRGFDLKPTDRHYILPGQDILRGRAGGPRLPGE